MVFQRQHKWLKEILTKIKEYKTMVSAKYVKNSAVDQKRLNNEGNLIVA